MLKRQRIVITGGSGFIGSFLVEELIKKKFKNIVVMDNDPQPKIGADYVKCDVFKDWSIVRKQIKTGDLVVHLAYSFTTSISGIDRIKDAEKNIIGTLKFLEICKDRKIKKIIFASSGGTIYGNHDRKCRESDETYPINFYGITKLAIEKYFHLY